MVLDAVAVIIFIVIIQGVLYFRDDIVGRNKVILSSNGNIEGLIVWQWNLIWIFVALAVIVISLVMIYKPKKTPKKYVVNEENAQKYSDIVITAITCVRIPVLLAVFEMMMMHQAIMKYDTQSVFSLQIPLDILLSIIIIRFSVHRIKLIQPKRDDKEIRLKEN